jgi:hypothetical protein
VQILPKVSGLLLLFNANEGARGGDPARVPRVSTRLDLATSGAPGPRIRKFVREGELGDDFPNQLFLSDAESEWLFTVGSQEWDDIFVPDLPCPCRAELRITIQSVPGAQGALVPPALPLVSERIIPNGCSHLVAARPASGSIRYELRMGDGQPTPPTLRVCSLAQAFPVRELMRSGSMFNPVLRLAARLLPWPEGTRRGFGRLVPDAAIAGAPRAYLNMLDQYAGLGLADFKRIAFGIQNERPFLAVGDEPTRRLMTLVRNESERPLDEHVILESEDRIRIATPQGRLDLVWRAAAPGLFLDGLEDVFAGGFMLDRVDLPQSFFTWVTRYEQLDDEADRQLASVAYVVCRGRAGHVPAWPGRPPRQRVADPMLVGDPYLSANGGFSFSPVVVGGSLQVALTAAPDVGQMAGRTYFLDENRVWHGWTGETVGGAAAHVSDWNLATAEEDWSRRKKLQQFVVGSTLFFLTLSGTV